MTTDYSDEHSIKLPLEMIDREQVEHPLFTALVTSWKKQVVKGAGYVRIGAGAKGGTYYSDFTRTMGRFIKLVQYIRVCMQVRKPLLFALRGLLNIIIEKNVADHDGLNNFMKS